MESTEGLSQYLLPTRSLISFTIPTCGNHIVSDSLKAKRHKLPRIMGESEETLAFWMPDIAPTDPVHLNFLATLAVPGANM